MARRASARGFTVADPGVATTRGEERAMTAAAELEKRIYLEWWGLLRRPPIYLDLPLQRVELVAAG